MIDLRDLLKRFMKEVGEAEGVYFTPESANSTFSEEEVQLFRQIEAELASEDWT